MNSKVEIKEYLPYLFWALGSILLSLPYKYSPYYFEYQSLSQFALLYYFAGIFVAPLFYIKFDKPQNLVDWINLILLTMVIGFPVGLVVFICAISHILS